MELNLKQRRQLMTLAVTLLDLNWVKATHSEHEETLFQFTYETKTFGHMMKDKYPDGQVYKLNKEHYDKLVELTKHKFEEHWEEKRKGETTYYLIDGVEFEFDLFMRTLVCKYDGFVRFIEANPHIPWFVSNMIESLWDDVEPIRAAEVLQESNQEKRRVMLAAIGTQGLREALNPTLIIREKVESPQEVYDKTTGMLEASTLTQYYSLYEADTSKIEDLIIDKIQWVEMTDSSTDRKFHLPVDPARNFKSALDAIAWTVLCPYKAEDLVAIKRHGDQVLFKAVEGASPIEPWHMDKETYFGKLVAQS